MSSDDPRQSFEQLFAGDSDPWGFRTRWYEARKRALTLACLPGQRYGLAYEPGCANGELSAALASRCDRLLASDGIAAAVGLSRDRLREVPNAEVFQAWVPDDWDEVKLAGLDLLVISEVGFYLTAAQLQVLADKARRSLGASGTVLACHWRHEIKGFEVEGEAVHRLLHASLGMARLVHHEEDDFVLDVWSRDPRSVAVRGGLI